jgi:hypothetical protein
MRKMSKGHRFSLCIALCASWGCGEAATGAETEEGPGSAPGATNSSAFALSLANPACCNPVHPDGALECALEQLFCNPLGACTCDDASAAVSPPVNLNVALSASEGAPRDETQAPESSAGIESAQRRGNECACGGGSPSEPMGDCPIEYWFCNPSGHCRCAS